MKRFRIPIVAAIAVMVMLLFAHTLASTYIGNKNTGKFHYSSCSSVDAMNPRNKVYIDSREEAIDMGYVPCKRCNP